MLYYNGNWIEKGELNDSQLSEFFTIYEVVRVFKGSPVFIQDNTERLNASIAKSDLKLQCGTIDLRQRVEIYIQKCGISEGNIKYLIVFSGKTNNQGFAEYDEYMVQIPHRYPSETEYAQGVAVSTINSERLNPEIKYLNISLRELCNRVIKEKGVYELLLINSEGKITEGSRSNIFFIKSDRLYTSPDSMVLGGTARKRVLNLAKELGIEIIKEAPTIGEVSEYQAAFITGTSPLVLPIASIDGIEFDVENKTLRTLMEHYFNMILK